MGHITHLKHLQRVPGYLHFCSSSSKRSKMQSLLKVLSIYTKSSNKHFCSTVVCHPSLSVNSSHFYLSMGQFQPILVYIIFKGRGFNYYTPREQSSGGYIGITLSVRLSVCPSVCADSCPAHNFFMV